MITLSYATIQWTIGITSGIMIALISTVWGFTHKKACKAYEKAVEAEKSAGVNTEKITAIKEDITDIKKGVDYITQRVDKALNGNIRNK